MKISPLLQMMVKKQASDLYLTTGAFASIKVQGKLLRITRDPLRPGQIRRLAEELLTRADLDKFLAERELNKGLSLDGVGRFRMNLYFQRGEVSMVVRHIRNDIPSTESLSLPTCLKDMVMLKDGLMLFVGSTGSGKSTSMASLIQHRNQHAMGHILTIEDPIEFTFEHEQSIVGQRELGFDTLSYENAMREAMREAPDMIMVGEIRDQSTMESVLGFADTGHLVLSTLHAAGVIQALERILYLFSSEQKSRVLMDLSMNLRCITAQRLIPDRDSGRLQLVAEILVNTPYCAELIRTGRFSELREVIEKGGSDGMQTFDQALYQLHAEGKVGRDTALEYSSSRNDLEWRMNFSDDSAGKNKSRSEASEAPVAAGSLEEAFAALED